MRPPFFARAETMPKKMSKNILKKWEFFRHFPLDRKANLCYTVYIKNREVKQNEKNNLHQHS
jgi:hypothetical protein